MAREIFIDFEHRTGRLINIQHTTVEKHLGRQTAIYVHLVILFTIDCVSHCARH